MRPSALRCINLGSIIKVTTPHSLSKCRSKPAIPAAKVLSNSTFPSTVIQGDLPFLVGLPSLEAMRPNLNFEHSNLSFKLADKYHRLELIKSDGHLHLPFRSNDIAPVRNSNDQRSDKTGKNYLTYDDTKLTSDGSSYHDDHPGRLYPSDSTVKDAMTTYYTRLSDPSPLESSIQSHNQPQFQKDANSASYYTIDLSSSSGESATNIDHPAPTTNLTRDYPANLPAQGILDPIDTPNNSSIQPPTSPEPSQKNTKNTHHQHNDNIQLSPREIQKLHLGFGHGSHTDIEAYIRAAGM